MNKKRKPLRTIQTFSDFADKLSARWNLLTQPAKPVAPDAKGQDKVGLEDLLRQLVAIPTVTGNYDANHDALDYIDSFLAKRGMHITRLERNGIESLVATTRKTKTPKVALMAHLDVVPGSEELFSLREENGKYYGRGTLDMKFAIASYLKIVDDLQADLTAYDFGIFITTDEEAGGVDGSGYLASSGYLPKVCILPDGGDDWQIQTYSKGFLYLSVSVEGQPAHGSRPWLGDNAILRLHDILTEIRALFSEPHPEANTLNVGRIHGGNTINQVADYAEVLLDIRCVTEEESLRLRQALGSICKKYQAKYTEIIVGAATSFSLDDPFIAPFAKLITEKTGVEVVGSRTLGSNDARYFAIHDIPVISLYPKGGRHHGPGEWLDKESHALFTDITCEYVMKIAAKTTQKAPNTLKLVS